MGYSKVSENRVAPPAEVVRLEGVKKGYRTADGRVEALRGIDLVVSRGTIQGVIGFSGAGKSTLVRCLARLEQPDAGRVVVGGDDLAALGGAALRTARRKIGMVFQSYNLLRSATVAENVALPLVLAGAARAEARAGALEILHWVGLAERAESFPGQLSGGQRQRVAIARGLVARPELLLTDEPTSALDPETTSTVLDLLRRVRDELGLTILLVTHDMGSVRALSDRVAVLDAGRVVEEGPTREILLRPRSAAARRLLAPRHAGAEPVWSPPAGSSAARLSLQFLGAVTAEPVLWEVGRRFGVTVNVLSGEIDRSTATPYGSFVVDVSGPGDALAGALDHLRGRGVEVAQLEAA